MRRTAFPAALLATFLMTACGGSAHVSTDAAFVAGQSVSRAEVQAYVRYADSFYRSAYGADVGASCVRTPTTAPCRTLARQALARLLEERVVTAFAATHHITVGANGRAAVATQLNTLRTGDPTTQRLLRTHVISSAFLARLLTTEALVRKVERAVTYAGSSRGSSYHVHTYGIPIDAAGSAAKTYRRAERLATDGGPVPQSATQHVRWVAAFRLPAPLARSLQAAANGDFVGPFRQGDHYLVVRRLGAGIHAYGKPARIELETRLFRRWLAARMRTAAPRCFDGSGKSVGCPLAG